MRVILVFVALLLSACSNLPQQIGQVNDAMNNMAERMQGDGTSMYEERNAAAVRNARDTVSVRTGRLGHPATPMVQQLRQACMRGLDVSVILHVSGQRSAASVAGTCVKVFITDHPDLRDSPPVILTDGIFVTVNGAWVASNDKQSRREYYSQQQIKQLAVRLQ